MSDVKRFKAPGPWITRELRDCVQASDYDAIAAQLATAQARVEAARVAFEELFHCSDMMMLDGDYARHLAKTWLAVNEFENNRVANICPNGSAPEGQS